MNMIRKSNLLCVLLSLFGFSLSAQTQSLTFPSYAEFDEESRNLEAQYLADRPNEAAIGKRSSVQLDSILSYDHVSSSDTWTPTLREVFQYPNALEQITWMDIWEADMNHWKNVRRGIYQHDPESRIETIIWSEWDDGSQQLIDYTRRRYESDMQNRILRFEVHDWVSNIWQARTQMNWEYEENSQDYLLFRQRVNPSTNSFEKSQKDSVSFYPNGQLQSSYRFFWQQQNPGFDWGLNDRNLFYQDSLGRTIEEISANFDAQSQAWMVRKKYVNTYDSTGNRIERKLLVWESDSGQWSNNKLEFYTYNEEGKEIILVKQIWNGDLSQWQNDYKTETSYHADGKQAISEEYRWIDGAWTKHDKEEYSYNMYEERERIIYSDGDLGNDQWIKDRRVDFFWSEPVLANDAHLPLLNCDFPNPISLNQPYLCEFFEAGKNYKLRLYDLQGRLKQQSQFPGHESFSLSSHLSPGLYILTFFDEFQLVFRQKIIIE